MRSRAVSDKTINSFRSYLPNRTFIASLESEFLKLGIINTSVTQNLLGSLSFLLYINDILQAFSNLCESFVYLRADDASIFIFLNKDFSMYLITNHQFFLVKIKLNTFFSVRRKTYQCLR